MVCFGPNTVFFLQGVQDVAALLFRSTRVKHTKPLLEVDAWAFVVLVMGEGIGHGLNQVEGQHIAGLVKRRCCGRVHGTHGLSGRKVLSLSGIGANPGFSATAMALVAGGVDHKVANDGMAGKGFNANSATIFGQISDLGTVSENDAPVDPDTRGGRSCRVASSEGKTAVNVLLHGHEKVLNGCVAGNTAC